MKKIDIMGEMLIDYLNGNNEATYAIRMDDGRLDDKPRQGEFYFTDYSQWSEQDKRAMNFVRGRVLDIGAGAGRHSLYLQRLGLEVHPIDLSPGAVEVMERRGLTNVRLMNIWELDYPVEYFDTVLLMFNGLGLAGCAEGVKNLLRYLYDFVIPGGRLVATVIDPYKTENENYLQYHDRNRNLGRMGGQMKIRLERGDKYGEWFDLLLLSPEELIRITEESEWQMEAIIHNEENSPFYTAIFKKPGMN